jgi:hypothetical protein
VGLKQAPARYHLSRQGALPQFNVKDNPFRATARPALSRVPQAKQAAAPTKPTPDTPPVAIVQSETTEPKKSQPAILAPKTPAKAIEQKHKTPERNGGSEFKLSQLWPWARTNRPRPTVARGSRSLVQGELTLDGVKVVRNDLTDTDLEIVQRVTNPAPAKAREPDETAAQKAPAGHRLGRMAERLFGAAKP